MKLFYYKALYTLILNKCEMDGQVVKWVDERKEGKGLVWISSFISIVLIRTPLINHSSVEIIHQLFQSKPRHTDWVLTPCAIHWMFVSTQNSYVEIQPPKSWYLEVRSLGKKTSESTLLCHVRSQWEGFVYEVRK